jgi:hypothetical protein
MDLAIPLALLIALLWSVCWLKGRKAKRGNSTRTLIQPDEPWPRE